MSGPAKPAPPGASPSVPSPDREYNVFTNPKPLYTQQELEAAKPGEAPKLNPIPTGRYANYPVNPRSPNSKSVADIIRESNRRSMEAYRNKVQAYETMGEEQSLYSLTPGGYRFVKYPKLDRQISVNPADLGEGNYIRHLQPNTRGQFTPEAQQALWQSTLRNTAANMVRQYPGIDGPSAENLYPRHILDDYRMTVAAMSDPNSLSAATDQAATQLMYEAEKRFGHFTNGAWPTFTEQLPSDWANSIHMSDWTKTEDGTAYQYQSPVARLRRSWANDFMTRLNGTANQNETLATNSALNAAWNFAEGSPFGLSARLLDLLAWTRSGGKPDGLKWLTGSSLDELRDEYVEAYTRVHGPSSMARALGNFELISTLGQGLGTVTSAGLLNTAPGLKLLDKGIGAVQKGAQAIRLPQTAQALYNLAGHGAHALKLPQLGQVVSNAVGRIPGAKWTGDKLVQGGQALASTGGRMGQNWLDFGWDSLANQLGASLQMYQQDPTMSTDTKLAITLGGIPLTIAGNIRGGKAVDAAVFNPLRQYMSGAKWLQPIVNGVSKGTDAVRNVYNANLPGWTGKALGWTAEKVKNRVVGDLSNMAENAAETGVRGLYDDLRFGRLNTEESTLKRYWDALKEDPLKALGSSTRLGLETAGTALDAGLSFASGDFRAVARGTANQQKMQEDRSEAVDAIAQGLESMGNGTAAEQAKRLREGLEKGDASVLAEIDTEIGLARTSEVMGQAVSSAMSVAPQGVDKAAWLQTADGQIAVRAAAVPALMRQASQGVPVDYDYLFDNSTETRTTQEGINMLKRVAIARQGLLGDGKYQTALELKLEKEQSGEIDTLLSMARRDPVTKQALMSFMKAEARQAAARMERGESPGDGDRAPLGDGFREADVIRVMQSFTDDERTALALNITGQFSTARPLMDMLEGKDLSSSGAFGRAALEFYLNNAGVEGRQVLGYELSRLIANETPKQIREDTRRLMKAFSEGGEAMREVNGRMLQIAADVVDGMDGEMLEGKVNEMTLDDMGALNAAVCSPEGQELLRQAREGSGTGDPELDARLKRFGDRMSKAVETKYREEFRKNPAAALPLVLGMKLGSEGYGTLGKAMSDPTTFYSLVTLILTGCVALFLGGGDDDKTDGGGPDAQAMERADRQRELWLRQSDMW